MIIVQIAGRLGRDAETRFTPSGQKVTNLALATNVRKGGKEETVWWRVTIWGERFDKLLPYFKKGSALIVVGEMGKPEIWTDKEGRPQVSLEITAEIIRFSPFGNPDQQRTGQEQGGAAAGSHGNVSNVSHQTQNNSYGNDPHGDFSASHAGSHAAASHAYGAASLQGSAAHYAQTTPGEDPLPF